MLEAAAAICDRQCLRKSVDFVLGALFFFWPLNECRASAAVRDETLKRCNDSGRLDDRREESARAHADRANDADDAQAAMSAFHVVGSMRVGIHVATRNIDVAFSFRRTLL